MRMTTDEFNMELEALCRKFCGDPVDRQSNIRRRVVITQTTTIITEAIADVERDAEAAYSQLFGRFF